MAVANPSDDTRQWGPPADLGRHPADIAGGAWEAREVARLRGRNVPWPHVARQLGKCERALRDLYDYPLMYGAASPPPGRAALPVAPRPPADLLAAIEARPGLSAQGLMLAIDYQGQHLARQLETLARRGWARNLVRTKGAAGCWVTTEAGRAELARREVGAEFQGGER